MVEVLADERRREDWHRDRAESEQPIEDYEVVSHVLKPHGDRGDRSTGPADKAETGDVDTLLILASHKTSGHWDRTPSMSV